MKQIDHLTNERLRNMFDNQFELVNYAIKMAEHFIKSGREPFVHQDTQNLASQILEVIESGKDRFREMPNEETFIAEVESVFLGTDSDEEDDDEGEGYEEETQTVEAM